jgi:NADPH2 dehydrogenase
MEPLKITRLDTREKLLARLQQLGLEMPLADHVIPAPDGPLAEPLRLPFTTIGNRFTILPMEGWDSHPDGKPSDLTYRRWRRFGLSGAKLIWGGEAVAVRHDGRANPNQVLFSEDNLSSLERLRLELLDAHQQAFGNTDDLYVGLQLTHSGRFARPNDKRRLEPQILYRHPVLDGKFAVDDAAPLMSDDEIQRLIDQFVEASVRAYEIGFQFVDIKHCHGYLGHEFLSSYDRPGKFGGTFENRTRFLRSVVHGIRSRAPQLQVGVRVSIVDMIPFEKSDSGVGRPTSYSGSTYKYAFGGDGTGTGIDLTEPGQLMTLLESLGITLVCSTVGSPYYVPHMQRPAWYPPSDGYQLPEDPLVGVARQLEITAEIKRRHANLIFVGSGYSYLQEWLGHVAQAAVSEGWVDSVGLGRMVLSYPDLPADLLAGRPYQKQHICRTFSDCTTAPRNGLVSGCFPLDDYYKQLPERKQLQAIKKGTPSS